MIHCMKYACLSFLWVFIAPQSFLWEKVHMLPRLETFFLCTSLFLVFSWRIRDWRLDLPWLLFQDRFIKNWKTSIPTKWLWLNIKRLLSEWTVYFFNIYELTIVSLFLVFFWESLCTHTFLKIISYLKKNSLITFQLIISSSWIWSIEFVLN